MNLFDKCKKGVDTFRGRHRSRQTPTDIYRQTWAHKISSAIFGACLHMPDVFDQIGAVSESLVSIDCDVEIVHFAAHIRSEDFVEQDTVSYCVGNVLQINTFGF